MEIKDYAGMDYKGKGIVWKRANNLTFTGLAFTTTPADPNTEVKMIKDSQGLMQKAYASIIKTKRNQDNGEKIICPHCSNEIILASMETAHKEGVMEKGPKGKKEEEVVEDIEELDDDEEDDEVADEEVEEDTEDTEVEEDTEDEDTDNGADEEVEDEEAEDEEVEDEAPKPKAKKKNGVKPEQTVSKVKRARKTKPSNSNDKALKLKLEEALQNITDIYEAMKI
jgi:TATA-binding protein-associated factor Taf7